MVRSLFSIRIRFGRVRSVMKARTRLLGISRLTNNILSSANRVRREFLNAKQMFFHLLMVTGRFMRIQILLSNAGKAVMFVSRNNHLISPKYARKDTLDHSVRAVILLA